MSELGGKKKHPNIKFLLVFAIFMLITYPAFVDRFGLVFLIPAWIFVLLVWVCFFMRTRCHYELGVGRGCSRKVWGKLNGCHDHNQLKHDAVWAAIGLRNPGLWFRPTWTRQDQAGRRGVGPTPMPADRPPPQSETNARRGTYDLSMWFLTAVSAVAAVVPLVFAK